MQFITHRIKIKLYLFFKISGSTINETVSSLAKIYFSQLSTEEISKLYEKYKVDFELFEYDHSPYYKYSNDYTVVK